MIAVFVYEFIFPSVIGGIYVNASYLSIELPFGETEGLVILRVEKYSIRYHIEVIE